MWNDINPYELFCVYRCNANLCLQYSCISSTEKLGISYICEQIIAAEVQWNLLTIWTETNSLKFFLHPSHVIILQINMKKKTLKIRGCVQNEQCTCYIWCWFRVGSLFLYDDTLCKSRGHCWTYKGEGQVGNWAIEHVKCQWEPFQQFKFVYTIVFLSFLHIFYFFQVDITKFEIKNKFV